MKKAPDLYSVVSEFFHELEWRFDEVPGDNPTVKIVRADFQGDNGLWRCYAEVHEDRHIVIFYSLLDTRIPENQRLAVAEFLTRANYGLMLGNFEMDLNDGETRYKTSVSVEGDRLTTALLKPMVFANLGTFDTYLRGIMRVAFGDKKPADALAEIEETAQAPA